MLLPCYRQVHTCIHVCNCTQSVKILDGRMFLCPCQVNQSLACLGLAYTDIDTDCIIAMATVLHGNRTLRSVDLSRPLLHSRLEESTIHISRMLQVMIYRHKSGTSFRTA